MTKVIGLTGSIGMGKSTTAAMFAERGLPVWDADAAVSRLYAPGGAAVDAVAERFPEAVRDGAVDRTALRAALADDSDGFADLEAIVHPLVAADRDRFVAEATAPAVVLDVPLLFETGLDRRCDLVVVVSVDAETQAARVLKRPGMTRADLGRIRDRQTPDAEKRARADVVIPTDRLESARQSVQDVVERITGAT